MESPTVLTFCPKYQTDTNARRHTTAILNIHMPILVICSIRICFLRCFLFFRKFNLFFLIRSPYNRKRTIYTYVLVLFTLFLILLILLLLLSYQRGFLSSSVSLFLLYLFLLLQPSLRLENAAAMSSQRPLR